MFYAGIRADNRGYPTGELGASGRSCVHGGVSARGLLDRRYKVVSKTTAWLIVASIGVLLFLAGCAIAGGWNAFGIGLGMIGVALIIFALFMLAWSQ